MEHQVKLCDSIHAFETTPVGCSEHLCGTSNSVFTNWYINSYFSIRDGKPYVHLEVVSKLFGKEVLFETNDYAKLQQWMEENHEEISNQINSKAEAWIEKNKSWLRK